MNYMIELFQTRHFNIFKSPCAHSINKLHLESEHPAVLCSSKLALYSALSLASCVEVCIHQAKGDSGGRFSSNPAWASRFDEAHTYNKKVLDNAPLRTGVPCIQIGRD